MSQIIPGWYDTPGACEILGGISRDAISKIAKAEGWHSVPVANGTALLHHAEDVLEYRDHQIRTKLLREQLGWTGRGLYRLTDVELYCPVCMHLAVEWPPYPECPVKWACIKGHGGTFDENGDCIFNSHLLRAKASELGANSGED